MYCNGAAEDLRAELCSCVTFPELLRLLVSRDAACVIAHLLFEEVRRARAHSLHQFCMKLPPKT